MVSCMDLNVNHFLYEVSRNLEQSRLVFEQFNTRSRIISPDEWLVIKRKALRRDNFDCPICLTSVRDDQRSVTLTSCSHIFHDTCLLTFESLAVSSQEQGAHNFCPVCRSSYQKDLLEDFDCRLSSTFETPSYYS
ncbi:RNF32 [Bugula neritina]|uniref:RNF32 n=1 Tax=Bugula neritina TaxID=10212 RepID=A0A7J7KR12_BUGNE|nr:RNF32 [Bugula neritina]